MPAVRGVPAGLAAAVMVTLPLPPPAAGDTLAQLAPDEAVHAQPAGALTLTVPEELPDPNEKVVGDTANVQVTPAWVTGTAWPATVSVVLRAPGEALAPTTTLTGAVPPPAPP